MIGGGRGDIANIQFLETMMEFHMLCGIGTFFLERSTVFIVWGTVRSGALTRMKLALSTCGSTAMQLCGILIVEQTMVPQSMAVLMKLIQI